MPCELLYVTLQFYNKTKKAFKTRMPSCDTSLFTGLIRPLQLSQWQKEFTLYQYYRAMNENALPWQSQFFFSPRVFLPFLQIQPISALSLQQKLSHCIFLLSHTSHFLSTLSSIFHLFSPSLLPPSNLFCLGSPASLQFLPVSLSSHYLLQLICSASLIS